MPLIKTEWKRPTGFTLMELVLVLGLLGLLVGLTAPAVGGIRTWLADRECRMLFMELESACRHYRMQHGRWPEGLTEEEVSLNDETPDWRVRLAPYLEVNLLGETVSDGFGNTDIRMALDADGDHWIEGHQLLGLPETERPDRLWARVALYSLHPDGQLAAKNW